MRTSEGQQEEYRVSHMIFADNCYQFAASIEEVSKMIGDTTEELRRRGYREVVQPCFLHSCEGWSWNKEMLDALHGWESRNLDLMSSRKWIKRGLILEWFRANQIRMTRKRFAGRGGECIEWLMLQRIWPYKEKIFDKKRTKQTDQMMRDILRHADPLWRDQRSANARLLDPRNQNKMKRRCCAHELGQSYHEMKWLSKMVGLV